MQNPIFGKLNFDMEDVKKREREREKMLGFADGLARFADFHGHRALRVKTHTSHSLSFCFFFFFS